MNPTPVAYPSWQALEHAIKAAATTDTNSAGLQVGDRITHARFDRFLCRVFSDPSDTTWLLKGGTGLLARVPDTRRTQDVDLASTSATLDEAVDDLERRVDTDLGDHLRFTLAGQRSTGRGNTQPAVETRELTFDCWAGNRRLGHIKVDIVVGPPPVGTVEVQQPADRLHLNRPLITHPYRLFPLVDQVAEKVCATMNPNYPDGRPSSRVKDLVDLVVISRTQAMQLHSLRQAITTHRQRARIPPFTQLHIPHGWGGPYAALAAKTPAAASCPTLASAAELTNTLLAPALDPHLTTTNQEWNPHTSTWSTTPTPTTATAYETIPTPERHLFRDRQYQPPTLQPPPLPPQR